MHQHEAIKKSLRKENILPDHAWLSAGQEHVLHSTRMCPPRRTFSCPTLFYQLALFYCLLFRVHAQREQKNSITVQKEEKKSKKLQS
jgi:hypothetical protein